MIMETKNVESRNKDFFFFLKGKKMLQTYWLTQYQMKTQHLRNGNLNLYIITIIQAYHS